MWILTGSRFKGSRSEEAVVYRDLYLAYTQTHELIRESWNAFRFNWNDNNAREKFSYLLNYTKAAVVVCNYLIKDFQIIDKQIN